MGVIGLGLGDDLGPEKILLVRQQKLGLEAIVVVDNVACGPAIGGVRMAPDVTVAEVWRLARAMTLKNAAAGLPHGGGKAGIVADPACAPAQKETLVRTFARQIRELVAYIPGPDMGTNEACMAWMQDEIGRVVGLPRVVGGIPLDEIGATGFGLAVAAEVAAPAAGIDLAGGRLAVQGFGAVGQHAARFLAERGVTLVAASDSRGAVHNPAGLDVDALIVHKQAGVAVSTFAGGQPMAPEALVGVACDIWLPAARPDVLTEANVGQLKAKLILQGANIPATDAAEQWMHAQGMVNIPDFIANAGGVICAAVEYHSGTQSQAMAAIAEKSVPTPLRCSSAPTGRTSYHGRRPWRWPAAASRKPCATVDPDLSPRVSALHGAPPHLVQALLTPVVAPPAVVVRWSSPQHTSPRAGQQKGHRMERRLWAYTNGAGWFAVEPESCDYDEDQVDTVEPVLEAETKHALMQKAAAENDEIVMWLE